MKTGELSKILSVDRDTLVNWIKNPILSRFFSMGARGEHGSAHRIFDDADVLVLNTIRALRTSGTTDWIDLARYLDSGQREQEFPKNAISLDPRTIPLQQAEQSAKAMATLAERDAAFKRVNELELRIHDLETKVVQVEKERDEVKERLLREIAELNRQIGRLEGRLESKD